MNEKHRGGWACRLWFQRLVLLASGVLYPAFGEAAETGTLGEKLAALRRQYQGVSSVQFKVKTTTTFPDPGKESADGAKDTPLQGTYDYYMAGKNYRINTALGTGQHRPAEWQLAYDGTRFQLFERDTSRLTYKKADDNRQPMCPPNPILAPLGFIRPIGDEQGVKLQWAEIQQEAFWERLGKEIQVREVPDPQGQGTVAEFRGKSADGQPFVSRVRFGSAPSHLPTQIDWMPSQGMGIRYTIDQYQRHTGTGKESYWPKSVRIGMLNREGQVLGQMTSQIEDLKVDGDLPTDIFTLDFAVADVVWDDDAQVFIKTKGGFRLAPNVTIASGNVPKNADTVVSQGGASRQTAGQSVEQGRPGEPQAETRGAIPAVVDPRSSGLRWAGMVLLLLAIVLIGIHFRSRRMARGTASGNPPGAAGQ